MYYEHNNFVDRYRIIRHYYPGVLGSNRYRYRKCICNKIYRYQSSTAFYYNQQLPSWPDNLAHLVHGVVVDIIRKRYQIVWYSVSAQYHIVIRILQTDASSLSIADTPLIYKTNGIICYHVSRVLLIKSWQLRYFALPLMTHEAHTLYKWVMIATLSTYFGNDVPYTSCLGDQSETARNFGNDDTYSLPRIIEPVPFVEETSKLIAYYGIEFIRNVKRNVRFHFQKYSVVLHSYAYRLKFITL
uniref:Uncharacterized protein n=1 Tax=Rhizophagus irregularis (strain DAOM 181602 / DAOM 197198 / MUCL 43194) TaxID=747089 RepID=U9U542_RHIID